MTVYATLVKRTIDIAVSAVLLVLLSPLFVVVAIFIGLEDGGPIIFKQQRVGRHGAPFVIYKFRSMPVDTPNLPSLAARAIEVTRVGRVVRRMNIDELPQLVNVLKGDMSLIGPRPALPSQTALVASRKDRGVMGLRPGLTGLAQVNSYDGMPEPEKLEWDCRYLRDISASLDASIIFRTILYLLKRPPVY